jgi:ligand-binding SRPBCC domain-containing protein
MVDYFKDVQTSDNQNIRVESFEGANSVRIKEALKILEINTDTQTGCSFTNYNDRSLYKDALFKKKLMELNEQTKPFFKNDVETKIIYDQIRYEGETANIRAQKSKRYVRKIIQKMGN